MKSNFRLRSDTVIVCVCIRTISLALSFSLSLYVCMYSRLTRFQWILLTYSHVYTYAAVFTIFPNPTIWVPKFEFFNDDQIVSIHKIENSMLASEKNILPYKISNHSKGGTFKNGWLFFKYYYTFGMDSLAFEEREKKKKLTQMTEFQPHALSSIHSKQNVRTSIFNTPSFQCALLYVCCVLEKRKNIVDYYRKQSIVF